MPATPQCARRAPASGGPAASGTCRGWRCCRRPPTRNWAAGSRRIGGRFGAAARATSCFRRRSECWATAATSACGTASCNGFARDDRVAVLGLLRAARLHLCRLSAADRGVGPARSAPGAGAPIMPRVAIIVVGHNEATRVRAKLRNLHRARLCRRPLARAVRLRRIEGRYRRRRTRLRQSTCRAAVDRGTPRQGRMPERRGGSL